MSEFLVIPRQYHDDLVIAAYTHRGYAVDEAAEGARLAAEAARRGPPQIVTRRWVPAAVVVSLEDCEQQYPRHHRPGR